MQYQAAGWFATGMLTLATLAVPLRGHTQEPGEQTAPLQGPQSGSRGQFAGGQRVFGTVTAVNGANVTVKSIENGQSTTVVTTANTRLMKGAGEPLVLTSLKPGDGVTAMGQLDAPNNTLHAAVLFGMTPDQTKQMLQTAAEMKANLGKTYIAGRVTALDIDNLKMTVQRPDGQAQTIGFDEGTSFRKNGRVVGITGVGGQGGFGGAGGYGRRSGNGAAADGGQASTPPSAGNTPAITGGESITLADIKVGDNVVGLGSVKAGAFVPSMLDVQVRGEGGGRRRGGSDSAGGPASATSQPASAGPGR